MRQMARIVVGLGLALFGANAGAWAQGVELLLLLPRHYGANHFLNVDDYEGFGWHVTTAAVSPQVPPCAAYGGPLGCPVLEADLLIAEIDELARYDVVALAPASQYSGHEPYDDLVASAEALDLIRRAVNEGLVVYAPCTGVRVLAAAGVLDGVRVTGHASYRAAYEAAGATYLGAGIPPVIDGPIVTATRGLYFHEANAEAVARALEHLHRGLRSPGPEVRR